LRPPPRKRGSFTKYSWSILADKYRRLAYVTGISEIYDYNFAVDIRIGNDYPPMTVIAISKEKRITNFARVRHLTKRF